MRTIDLLRQRYANRANAPLSVKECAMLHGTKWTNDENQMREFCAEFVICRDGIIRTR